MHAFSIRRRLNAKRAFRALVPGIAIGLPPLYWVASATYRASLTSLGRDQGIFQYVAYAILKGAKDYKDVRDVNGPLTHMIHMLFLLLGGGEEHRFRVLDLLITGAVFFGIGAVLPALWNRRFRLSTVRGAAQAVGWGAAAWVVMSAQYLHYIFWDTAQRESFFDWFLIASLGAQLVAQKFARDEGETSRVRALLIVAGALSVVTWFGKPTNVFVTFGQLITLLVDDVSLKRTKRVQWVAIGGAFGALTQIAFLLRYGDIGAFAKIYFVDVPKMYRFIWPRTAAEIMANETYATMAAFTFVTSTLLLGLIYEKELPRRALSFALFPLAGLLGVFVQAKGFAYHFHPVSAGLSLEWLVVVAWLWGRKRAPGASHGFPRLVPVLASIALALKVATAMPYSPYIQGLWLLSKGEYAEDRQSKDYLVYFQTQDFFPWELREAAKYLQENTKADDKVQAYGMDPYVLFLAQRLSASPYIYAYDLNADAALAGGEFPAPRGAHPTPAQAKEIRQIRKSHEDEMLAQLKSSPPAAFVFHDKSPLITWQDAVQDFEEHCTETAAWMKANYSQTRDFNGTRVWLRRDVTEKVAKKPENRESAPAPAPAASDALRTP